MSDCVWWATAQNDSPFIPSSQYGILDTVIVSYAINQDKSGFNGLPYRFPSITPNEDANIGFALAPCSMESAMALTWRIKKMRMSGSIAYSLIIDGDKFSDFTYTVDVTFPWCGYYVNLGQETLLTQRERDLVKLNESPLCSGWGGGCLIAFANESPNVVPSLVTGTSNINEKFYDINGAVESEIDRSELSFFGVYFANRVSDNQKFLVSLSSYSYYFPGASLFPPVGENPVGSYSISDGIGNSYSFNLYSIQAEAVYSQASLSIQPVEWWEYAAPDKIVAPVDGFEIGDPNPYAGLPIYNKDTGDAIRDAVTGFPL